MATTLLVVLGLLILAGAVYLFLIRPGGADGYDFGHTQRTLQSGTLANATVLQLRDTGGRLNSNPAIEFQLEVQAPDGLVYTAMTRAIISTVDLPRFQPGARISVKIDPADRGSVAIVP
ncbi:MAG: hypothetical protein JNK55_22305 [Rubrivivax sp.]|nr:hypothetical protein [Rubrivivax sp.]